MDIRKIEIDHFVAGKDFKMTASQNAIAAAQDYNSSRSNKANSIATGRDHSGTGADSNFNQDKFASLSYSQKRMGLQNYGAQLGIQIN